MQAAAEHMKRQRSGRIVVTASVAGLRAERHVGYAYVATKAAVVNLVRMRLRHLQVVRRHQAAAPPPDLMSSAERQVLDREDQRVVVAALEQLAPRQREAIVLRYWMDLREAEIAAAMGISCGAVKTHISRAMAALTEAVGVRA